VKTIDQFLLRKSIDARLKILTDAPDSTGLSLNAFRLESFEFEVLQMGLVILLET